MQPNDPADMVGTVFTRLCAGNESMSSPLCPFKRGFLSTFNFDINVYTIYELPNG